MKPYEVVEDGPLSLDEPPSKARVFLSQFLKWLLTQPSGKPAFPASRILKWLCVVMAVVSWWAAMNEKSWAYPDSAFQQQVVILSGLWSKSYLAQGCLFMLGAIFFQKEQHRRQDGK